MGYDQVKCTDTYYSKEGWRIVQHLDLLIVLEEAVILRKKMMTWLVKDWLVKDDDGCEISPVNQVIEDTSYPVMTLVSQVI